MWQLKLGIESLLKRSRVSGRGLEQVLGYCTSTALLRRETLSCFSHVYLFARQAGAQEKAMPTQVRQELRCFAALLPLVYHSMHVEWSTEVYMH